ncbi:MAG: penicillin-binding transpeptidase domain-containing protein, partial [Pseudomonadota bacterium]
PSFDPNVMTGRLSREEEAEMHADPHLPFIDRTLRQHYFPGSTYKFVAAAAAVEEGLVSPTDRVFCRGYHELGRRTFRCPKPHGSVSLYEAMTQSCNVYFWHLAEIAGIDRLAKVARDFGFGAPTGLGLNGDVPGNVPVKAWYEKRGGFRIGYTLNTAIGQGDTEVTVLQLALAYAAIANGGDLWVPQVVDRIETATGETIMKYEPKLRRKLPLSAKTLELIGKGLWGVVNDPRGTAFHVRPDDVTVSGKTGTAQVRRLQRRGDSVWHDYRDHAWFVCYAPSESPDIAVAALVEHGGKGGAVAAPIAMQVVRSYSMGGGVGAAAASTTNGTSHSLPRSDAAAGAAADGGMAHSEERELP